MPIVRVSAEEISDEELAKAVKRLKKRGPPSDEEIARQIASDPDIAPDMTDALRRGEGRIVRAPETVDVRAIREALGLTQEQFAARFGFSVWSVRNWEQGVRRPEGPARVLLRVIEREPEAVTRALEGDAAA